MYNYKPKITNKLKQLTSYHLDNMSRDPAERCCTFFNIMT